MCRGRHKYQATQAGIGIGVGDYDAAAIRIFSRRTSAETRLFSTATMVRAVSVILPSERDWEWRPGSSVGARES
jgi:hypothetical protein